MPDIPAGRSSAHQSIQNNFPFGEENEQWGDDTGDAVCVEAMDASSHQCEENNVPLQKQNEQWGDDTSDALCAEVLDIVENAGLCENQGKIYLNIISGVSLF